MSETKDDREVEATAGALDSVEAENPAAEEGDASDQNAELRSEAQELREELERTRDQLLRKAAEFQNYRRRTEDEKRMLVQIGKGSVVEQLLDVVDDLARTVDAAQGEGVAADSIRQGVEMVYEKLMTELKKVGVEPIPSVGEPFDERMHEALMRQPAPEGTPPGIILQELQRGYRMDDRVLRHARVVVATEPD